MDWRGRGRHGDCHRVLHRQVGIQLEPVTDRVDAGDRRGSERRWGWAGRPVGEERSRRGEGRRALTAASPVLCDLWQEPLALTARRRQRRAPTCGGSVGCRGGGDRLRGEAADDRQMATELAAGVRVGGVTAIRPLHCGCG